MERSAEVIDCYATFKKLGGLHCDSNSFLSGRQTLHPSPNDSCIPAAIKPHRRADARLMRELPLSLGMSESDGL